MCCCGGVWTNARLREAGYDVDGLCECCKAMHTLNHRWFAYERSADVRKETDPVLFVCAKNAAEWASYFERAHELSCQ